MLKVKADNQLLMQKSVDRFEIKFANVQSEVEQLRGLIEAVRHMKNSVDFRDEVDTVRD